MTEEVKESQRPIRRKERDLCWSSRDEYFKCLEAKLVPLLHIDHESKVLTIKGEIPYMTCSTCSY